MTEALATETACIDLPLQTRADVRLQSETIDAEARTVEVVWSTGAAVRRTDLWTGKRYDEVLSLDPRHVDLSRLNSGAPLLNAHGAFDLANVIGVVERAWIARSEGAYEGRATVRFSARDDVEPLWQDVRAGIIRNVSVGYTVRAYEVIEQDGQVPVWRAIDWQPVELSAVPVGADGGAGFRQGQGLTPCRLHWPQGMRSINRVRGTHQPESKGMNEDLVTAAETSAANRAADPVDGDVREAKTATANDSVEVRLVVERPPAAETSRTTPNVQAAPVDTDAIDERVLANERARIAGIYDAARKLGLDQKVADTLKRASVPSLPASTRATVRRTSSSCRRRQRTP